MTTSDLRIKVVLSPGAREDLARMNKRAHAHPHGKDEALLEATIIMLHRLNGRRHPTKPLDYDSRFADLSDCDTTYVGADPYEKPPLRIVSRDLRPSRPGGVTPREIVAIGQRQDSQVYRTAGRRLGRPVGVTLDELATRQSPALSPSQPQRTSPQTPSRFDQPSESGSDLEFG